MALNSLKTLIFGLIGIKEWRYGNAKGILQPL